MTTLRSPEEPELYVDARVEEQASEYLKWMVFQNVKYAGYLAITMCNKLCRKELITME